MRNKPILIMAGGTGGHIYPALAVAKRLQKRNISLLWLGTKKGLESKIIPQQGYKLLTIHINGLRGKGIIRWIAAPFSIFVAVCQAIIILIRYEPIAVLGMGGFASGPGGIASWLMRIPLCVHEQNAVAGLTNRILARFAHTTMEAFEDTFTTSIKAHMTGNPVRQDIIEIATPEQRFKNRTDHCLRLLVIGGSLGAKTLNKIVPETLSILLGDVDFQIKHQTGTKHLDQTKKIYQNLGIAAEIQAYIDDMAAAYNWADLVLCRAGAITIAEITAAGVASILIPYPYAVDNHQTANACYLSDQNAAILIPEKELNTKVLAELLHKFSLNRDGLLKMANICLSLSKSNAADRVADLCMRATYA